MARLLTVGFEIAEKGVGSTNAVDIDGGSATAADVQLQSSVFRSGAMALERVTGTSQWRTNWTSGTGTADRVYFARVYFRIAGTPSATTAVLSFVDSIAGQLARILITSGFKFRLDDGTLQIGSDSSLTAVADTWYRLELAMMQSATGGIEYAEARVDGTSFASSSALTSWTSNPIGVSLGGGIAVGQTTYYDDLAVNDDQGTDQNSWPGEGKIVLCKPISDNQVGSWQGGAGGTTNLWDAIDNTPPVGVAAETDTSQIESTTTNGTTEYRANLTTYTNAGIAADDLITVLHPVMNHAEDQATGTKTGEFGLNSNPSQTYTAFTFGDDSGAAGSWPIGWRWTLGNVVYEPTVTRGSSPVMGVFTNNASEAGFVDFMGMYVEYVEDAGEPPAEFQTFFAHRRRAVGGRR